MLALAGMPLARPWRQEQEQARVGLGAHLVALVGLEVSHEAGTTGDRLAVLLDLDLAARHHHPGALVHLVLLELFAGGQVDRDDPRLWIAAEHLRLMRWHVHRGEVPGLHARARYLRGHPCPRPMAAASSRRCKHSWSDGAPEDRPCGQCRDAREQHQRELEARERKRVRTGV